MGILQLFGALLILGGAAFGELYRRPHTKGEQV